MIRAAILLAAVLTATAAAAQTPAPAAAPDVKGLTEAELRQRLGEPAIARKEAAGAMWTYRLEPCALFIFLTRGEDQRFRVSGVSAGPRRRGQPNPSPDACLTAAVASKR